LKCSTKLATKSSRLSPAEKASLGGVRVAGKKMLYSAVRRGRIPALKCALKLFYSDSSVFDEEAAPSKRPWKRSRASSIPKDIPEPSPVEGMVEQFVFLSSYYDNYEGLPFLF
jgi:hypothetical protein